MCYNEYNKLMKFKDEFMHSLIISKYIVRKVKVRVVTDVDDFDKTLFSILGIIKNTDELGVLLIDKNDKEHFIPYTRIVEIQSLGTKDWSEYE